MKKINNTEKAAVGWTVSLLILITLCMCTAPSKYTLTKVVLDGNDNPIEGIAVELWDNKGNNKLAEGETDSEGKVVFSSLSAGHYTIKIPDFSIVEKVLLKEDEEIINKIGETGV